MISWTEILKANKGLHARDSFSELWGLKLKAARAEIPDYTITGALPLSFNSRAQHALKNYRVYGTAAGAGVQTENLFDKDATDTSKGYVAGAYLTSTGSEATSTNHFITEYISIPNGTTVIGCFTVSTNVRACFYDANKEFISSFVTGGVANVPQTAIYLRVSIAYSRINESMVLNNVSTAPSTYIPFGYKIPILNTSGETENKFDKDEYLNAYKPNVIINEYGAEISSTVNGYSTYKINVIPEQTYTLKGQTSAAYTYVSRIYWLGSNDEFLGRSDSFENVVPNSIFTFTTPQNCYKIEMQFSVGLDFSDVILVKGSTAPDHYIPHRYTSNYDLMIGDSKLYEDEYLDFESQKVYKYVDGVLTPQDPPAPFPTISTYKGENTLDSTEMLGDVSITGQITEMT